MKLFHTKWDIYVWLLRHPGWQYGEDMVKAGVTGRTLLYIRLTALEDRGLVVRREDEDWPYRHRFRTVDLTSGNWDE
jgi:DNA-binding HxlR family transcriptional regulator